MANYWYSYQGGSGSSPTLNPANYSRVADPLFCFGAGVVCAVYAPATNGNTPGPFSANLQDYIATATIDRPTIGKIFVYSKNG